MMGIVMPETCWACKKYKKIISGIQLVFYSSIVCLVATELRATMQCKDLAIVTEVPDEGVHPHNGGYGYKRTSNLHDVWYIIQILHCTHDHHWWSEIWTNHKKHTAYLVEARPNWNQWRGSQHKQQMQDSESVIRGVFSIFRACHGEHNSSGMPCRFTWNLEWNATWRNPPCLIALH